MPRMKTHFFPPFIRFASKWMETTVEREGLDNSFDSPLLQDGVIPTDYPSNLSRAYLARMTAHVATTAVIYRHLAKNAVHPQTHKKAHGHTLTLCCVSRDTHTAKQQPYHFSSSFFIRLFIFFSRLSF